MYIDRINRVFGTIPRFRTKCNKIQFSEKYLAQLNDYNSFTNLATVLKVGELEKELNSAYD